jgi:putative pyrroloquinoline-quinone binding quinoprotein
MVVGSPLNIGRLWRRWLVGAVIVLAVAAGVAVPAIANSDWHNVSYKSLSKEPAAPTDGSLPGTVQPRWTATGIPAGNDRPATDRTVVIGGGHEIAGHNPRTGATTWSYKRGNADLCSWVIDQTGSPPVAVAAYRNGSSCSDITGFDANTGKRQWYLNEDDLPAHVQLLTGAGMYYAWSSKQVIGFYLQGGGKAWSYSKSGCTFPEASAGDLGLVLVADCAGRTDLVALDGYTGKQKWDVLAPGARPQIMSVDSDIVVFSDVAGQNQLAIMTGDGQVVGTLDDSQYREVETAPTIVGQTWLGYDGNRVLAVDLNSAKLLWSVKSIGPATVHDNHVIVPVHGGFRTYGLKGHLLRRSHAAGSMTKPLQGLTQVGELVVVRRGEQIDAFG